MVMVRGLYGLKRSVAAWRTLFIETFRNMDFVPTVADTDIYRRKARKSNYEDCYELLLVYVDCVLCCLSKPHFVMNVMALTYDLKYESVELSTIYLGAKIKKYQFKFGKSHWSMSSTQCVNNLIRPL